MPTCSFSRRHGDGGSYIFPALTTVFTQRYVMIFPILWTFAAGGRPELGKHHPTQCSVHAPQLQNVGNLISFQGRQADRLPTVVCITTPQQSAYKQP